MTVCASRLTALPEPSRGPSLPTSLAADDDAASCLLCISRALSASHSLSVTAAVFALQVNYHPLTRSRGISTTRMGQRVKVTTDCVSGLQRARSVENPPCDFTHCPSWIALVIIRFPCLLLALLGAPTTLSVVLFDGQIGTGAQASSEPFGDRMVVLVLA